MFADKSCYVEKDKTIALLFPHFPFCCPPFRLRCVAATGLTTSRMVVLLKPKLRIPTPKNTKATNRKEDQSTPVAQACVKADYKLVYWWFIVTMFCHG
jgi:hypothetical protein